MNFEADDEAPTMVEIEELSIAGTSMLWYHIRIKENKGKQGI